MDTVYANTDERAGPTDGGGGDTKEDSINPMVARKRGGVVAVAWQPADADVQGEAGASDGVGGGEGAGGSAEDSTPSTPSDRQSHATGNAMSATIQSIKTTTTPTTTAHEASITHRLPASYTSTCLSNMNYDRCKNHRDRDRDRG